MSETPATPDTAPDVDQDAEHDAGPDEAPEGRQLSRRAAIGFIGASAVATAIGISVVRKDPGPEPALVQPGIPTAESGDTGSTGGVAAIGEAYMLAVPEEADGPTLLAALGISSDAVGDPNAQLDALADQVHADFDAGDTVQLSGWAFSLTEARLSALVALQARDQAAAAEAEAG